MLDCKESEIQKISNSRADSSSHPGPIRPIIKVCSCYNVNKQEGQNGPVALT